MARLKKKKKKVPERRQGAYPTGLCRTSPSEGMSSVRVSAHEVQARTAARTEINLPSRRSGSRPVLEVQYSCYELFSLFEYHQILLHVFLNRQTICFFRSFESRVEPPDKDMYVMLSQVIVPQWSTIKNRDSKASCIVHPSDLGLNTLFADSSTTVYLRRTVQYLKQ